MDERGDANMGDASGISARLNGNKKKIMVGVPVVLLLAGLITGAQWVVRTAYAGGQEIARVDGRICMLEKELPIAKRGVECVTTRVERMEVTLAIQLANIAQQLKEIKEDVRAIQRSTTRDGQ